MGAPCSNAPSFIFKMFLADPEFTRFEDQKLGDFRTALGVPLDARGDLPIGAMFLFAISRLIHSRNKEIELVTTFADQAVIAIENVRLFDEVQARTRDLSGVRWSGRPQPRRYCR